MLSCLNRNAAASAMRCTTSLGLARLTKRKLRASFSSALHSKIPTPDDVKGMPLTLQEMDNASLVQLAASYNHDARVEILKRHIMSVDRVTYEEACRTYLKLADHNHSYKYYVLPYYIGIFTSMVGAVVSIPLVFHSDTVFFFNESYVTANIPEPKYLGTELAVGSWAWKWMGAPVGTLSFILLCSQFARSQWQNLGLRPFTKIMKQRRAESLAKAFPQYNEKVVMDFSKSGDFVQDNESSAVSPNTVHAKVPTLDDVTDMPLTCQQMDNASLVQLAASKNHDARVEILKRHIMEVDQVAYEDADKTFMKIADHNDRYLFLYGLPYYFGIGMSILAANVSIPLVFNLETASWFNEGNVGLRIPRPHDLETPMEVGIWSWKWMDPVLGTLSFSLLCLQFARSQMQNLGIRPFTHLVKQKRAESLARAFSRYDRKVIMDYSKSDNFVYGYK